MKQEEKRTEKRESESNNILKDRLVTQCGKLISERSSKNAGYSRAYIYEPADFFEKQYGTLFFVIEIASPDPQVLTIGDLIIEVLKEEYYADLDRDPLVSFEISLKAVNKNLADLASSGQTSWLNKINAICACLNNRTLHLTQVGNAEAYLLRNHILTHISEGLYKPGDKIDPLKTFVNIASGDLEPEDKVLLSTPGLFYSTSLENIKRTLIENKPSKAVKKLSEFLKEEEDALGTSLLVIRFTTEEQLSNEEVEEEEEIWIAEPKNKLVDLTKKTKPIINQSKEVLSTGLKKVKNKSQKVLSPLLSKASLKIRSIKEKKLKSSSVSEPLPSYHPEKEQKEPEKDLKIKEKPTIEIAAPSKKIRKNIFKDWGEKIINSLSNLKINDSKFKNLYLYLFIFSLIIFSISLGFYSYKRKVNNELKRINTIYNEALEKEQEAEAVLIYQDRTTAKKLLKEAYQKAESIKDNNVYKEKAEALIKKIKTQEDKANLISRQTPQKLIDFSSSGQGIETNSLFIIANDFYTFQKNGTKIYRYDSLKKKIVEINKKSTSGKFQFAALTGDNTILLYDSEKGISEYNPVDNSVIPQTISLGGSWEEAKDIAVYQNYLYILSPKNNKIYRHAKTLGGYSIGVDYLENTNLKLTDALSLTIGETVWVLKSNGEVWQFSKGVQIPFGIKNMPFEFKKPQNIFTRPGFNNLYIVDTDNQAIIIIDTTGNYQGSYINEKISKAKGIFVDEVNKKIYFLAENKVYSLNL